MEHLLSVMPKAVSEEMESIKTSSTARMKKCWEIKDKEIILSPGGGSQGGGIGKSFTENIGF